MCVCLLCVCCLIMLLRFLFLLIGKILQLLLTVAHQLEFKDCPYNREKFPQHPEMTINLEESGRSLWDPIDPDKLKVVKQARKHCCWEIMQCKICFLTPTLAHMDFSTETSGISQAVFIRLSCVICYFWVPLYIELLDNSGCCLNCS